MTDGSASLVAMQRICKSFFGVPVLKDVDFELKPGEVHVLLGENGAGKSTLIKILSGAYRLDSGELSIYGKPINHSGYSPKSAETLGIVAVYQNFHLVPHLTVAENLALFDFPTKSGFIEWKRVRLSAQQALAKLNFEIPTRSKVKDLSVAKKQMLEIAIALSKEARIIIMDEPTAALSRHEIEILFATIREIKSHGMGIIYISHKLEEISEIGDRVTVLRDGRNVATLDKGEFEHDQIVELMIGKELAATKRPASLRQSRVVMEVNGIQTRRLPSPITFDLRANEVLGITGLVGAGKTELAAALFGEDQVSVGSVELLGKRIRLRSPMQAVRLGVGFVPEDRDARGLCLNMGIKQNLSLAHFARMRKVGFSPNYERTIVEDLIREVNVRATDMTQQAKYLSGGNKQKVVIGKWLGSGCRVLVLDEPTIGIDVGARAEIYGLIRKFVSEKDRAVVFLTSDMNEAVEFADRILVMRKREIVADLDPATTTKQQVLRYSLGIG